MGNPETADPDWPSAVILGASQTAVRGARALLRRGVQTVMIDCDPGADAFRSVYGPAQRCPHPQQQPEQWLQFMVDYARTVCERPGATQPPVLISSADRYLTAIAAHRDTLAAHFTLSAGVEMQGLLAEKHTQYPLAEQYGMPMPRSAIIHSVAEMDAFINAAQYPCLLKPVQVSQWQAFPAGHPLACCKVAVADSADELRALYALVQDSGQSVIAQEVILGEDTDKRVYLSCYDRNGRRIGQAMFKELRCEPLGFGPATNCETVIDDEVDAICDTFLRALNYRGICEIEVKRDARDGVVKLIEANARLSGSGDAAPYAGVDICWLHYLDLIGVDVEPVEPGPEHFRHIRAAADGAAIVEYWRAGKLSFAELLRSLRWPLRFYDLDWRDWRASARVIGRGLRSTVGTLIRPYRQR